MNVSEELIRNIVEKVVSNLDTDNTSLNYKEVDKSGIIKILPKHIKREKFDTGNPNDKVYVTDALTVQESKNMTCGVMEMEESTFDWELSYDEFDYVLEGTLKVIVDGREVVANAGEIIYLPKGAKIKFSAPNYAKFLYFIYPADWMDHI